MKSNQNLEVLQHIEKANNPLIVEKIVHKPTKLTPIKKKKVVKDLLI